MYVSDSKLSVVVTHLTSTVQPKCWAQYLKTPQYALKNPRYHPNEKNCPKQKSNHGSLGSKSNTLPLSYGVTLIVYCIHAYKQYIQKNVSFTLQHDIECRPTSSQILTFNFQHFVSMNFRRCSISKKFLEVHCIKNARNLKSTFDLGSTIDCALLQLFVYYYEKKIEMRSCIYS